MLNPKPNHVTQKDNLKLIVAGGHYYKNHITFLQISNVGQVHGAHISISLYFSSQRHAAFRRLACMNS